VAEIKLPPRLRTLYDLLDCKGEVAIGALYIGLDGDPGRIEMRDQQQWLGVRIARLNRRLEAHGKKVIPGKVLKNTYCLAKIG